VSRAGCYHQHVMESEALPLLVVEDSEDDVFLLQRALRQANVKNPVHIVTDGDEAINYLSGLGRFSDRTRHPMPFLIFLDLKLPFKGGLEILEWIQQQPFREDLHVVVLTSSAEDRDVVKAYQLGAGAYFTKSLSAACLQQLIARLYELSITRKPLRPSQLSDDLFHQRRLLNLKGGP
jgi:CheY-like chemotaxis protein